jgi:hypothetical protein
MVWGELNVRLMKWAKWEKGLFKYASIKYLKTKYIEQLSLFLHWLLIYP